MSGRGYAPRDVVNAPALAAAIEHRSRQRGDASEVHAWLMNHFHRHAISLFEAPPPGLIRVTTAAQWRALLGDAAPLPAWAADRLAGRVDGAPLWWVDPDSDALCTLESRLVEFLGSRRGTALEGKLMRINGPQALALWEAEHRAIGARIASSWREHEPQAVRAVWDGPGGSLVELLPDTRWLRAEMAYESQMMQHCLGQFTNRRGLEGGYGEHYARACEEGRLRLFSYRTGRQQPHITISAVVQADGRIAIDQVKGKQNRPPVDRYRDELVSMLNALPSTDHTPPDAAAIGLVRLTDGWHRAGEVRDERLQAQLVTRHPALVRELPQPSALVQWLVAARDASLLQGLPLASSVAVALETTGGA